MVALAADHTTDSNTGAHTGDPVPAFLCPPGVAPGARTAGVHFGESACRTGNLPRQSSHEFLLHTLGLMGF
jgi:2,3-bisphosphoglycerate-independent phosphoglycerate mutase